MNRVFLSGLLAAVSLFGFLDATYLTIEHYRGVVPPCSIVAGCEAVTTSSYSLFLTIPVALLGALYYLAVLFLTIAYLDTKKPHFIKVAASITPVGFLVSLYFIYLQAFVIKAWCLYCLGSALSSTILFILGILILTQHETWWQKLKEKVVS